MSNPLKYVTSTPTGTLRHANLGAGVASIQYDETFNSGLNPSNLTTYYLVYEPVEGTAVRIYAPANATELIQLAKSKGSSETTEAGALTWLSDNGYYPANKVLDNVVTDNLVLYTEATTTTSYPRSGTAWLDLSGEGDDLTGTGTSNSPTFDSTNSSLSFDGNAQRFASSTNCGVVGDQTLEAVFYEDSGTAPHTTIICTDVGYQYGIKLMSFKNNNRYGFWLGYGNSNHLGMISGNLDNDVIYHLLGTYKASTGQVKIYLNGELKMTDTMPETGNVSLNDGKINLGIDYHGLGTGYSMNGNIFSSRVYDKVLTQAEVNQNYHQGPIVTDDLKFSLDASNLVSFEPGTTAAFSLTGSSGAAAGDGVLTNGVGYSDSGNGAWTFDGVDDYIAVSNLGLSSHTMEGWINSDDNTQGGPTYATIVSVFGNYDGGASKYTYIGFIPELTFRIDNGVASHANIVTYANFPDDWFHVALTYDATSGKAIAYLNGVEIGSTTSTTNITFDSVPFNIARSVPGGYFDGSVAQSMVYDRALTTQEIQQNYNANVKKYT